MKSINWNLLKLHKDIKFTDYWNSLRNRLCNKLFSQMNLSFCSSNINHSIRISPTSLLVNFHLAPLSSWIDLILAPLAPIRRRICVWPILMVFSLWSPTNSQITVSALFTFATSPVMVTWQSTMLILAPLLDWRDFMVVPPLPMSFPTTVRGIVINLFTPGRAMPTSPSRSSWWRCDAICPMLVQPNSVNRYH